MVRLACSVVVGESIYVRYVGIYLSSRKKTGKKLRGGLAAQRPKNDNKIYLPVQMFFSKKAWKMLQYVTNHSWRDQLKKNPMSRCPACTWRTSYSIHYWNKIVEL